MSAFIKKLINQIEASSGNSNNHSDGQHENETSGAVDTINEVKTPRMFKVLLLNDDYTPMDFVILVLKRFFGKSDEDAHRIMLDVHKKGSGVAGTYTLEIAEMKAVQSNHLARQNQHPLKTILEPE